MSFSLPGLGAHVAIIGTQWGDEGKGKLVDSLSGHFDYICRATGGANAGHTIVVGDKKYVFHLLPSGLLHDGTTAVIGAGTVLSPQSIVQEITKLEQSGVADVWNRVMISGSAHVILPFHQVLDAENEKRKGDKKIGTTCRGIGPCYADKISRQGVRVMDLLDTKIVQEKLQILCKLHSDAYGIDLSWEYEYAQIEPFIDKITPLITDVPAVLHQAHMDDKRILFEGAQAHHLDIDHGTYPYVTSSNVSIGGMVTGLGVAPKRIESIIGIAKAYTTRVGEGPFITELHDDNGQHMRDEGHEYGSTTGRPRRCGWFDAVAVKRSVLVNGIDHINLTKLDVLTGLPELKICTAYGDTPTYVTVPGWTEDLTTCASFTDLPANAQAYVDELEKHIHAPITSIGIGPERTQLIVNA